MLQQQFKVNLTKTTHLPDPNSEGHIPIITVGDAFVQFNSDDGQKNKLKYASFYKRFFARIIDFIFILGIFLFVSGFLSLAILANIPTDSRDFLNKEFARVNVSVERTEKLLSCEVEENDKAICQKTLPYLAWMNFYNIIALMVLHCLYFCILTKLKFNTLGKKVFKIRVQNNNKASITWLQSVARESVWILIYLFLATSYLYPNFGIILSILIWIQTASLVFILTSNTKTSVHDIIAQTIVLKN